MEERYEQPKDLLPRMIAIVTSLIENSSLVVSGRDWKDKHKKRMAQVIMAMGNIQSTDIIEHYEPPNNYAPTSKEIIYWIKTNFKENISKGSYDSIRRIYCVALKVNGLSMNGVPGAPGVSMNSPKRGWGLTQQFSQYITSQLKAGVIEPMGQITPPLDPVPDLGVSITTGSSTVGLSPGVHNELQKDVIEKFLPGSYPNAEVLYFGDASDKLLHCEREKLEEIGIEISRGTLPDIIAFDNEKNHLIVIEAVHSSNPFHETRKRLVEDLLKDCSFKQLTFVTAFENMSVFSKYSKHLAWGTFVWVADIGGLIHYIESSTP